MSNDEFPLKSYCKGLLHSTVCVNLLQPRINGKESYGEQIINNYTMPNIGPVQNSYSFATGFITELILELSLPIYIASSSNSIKWYHAILGNIALKTIPRIAERIYKKSKLEDKLY